ncbi:LTA synthase family protein [Deefgea piscis]|uniref:LTA synthase family protein n=1 Tax=Deefgea piscis TaxID=2739061 RepID=A0A6M8SPM7_9NEIS|nr:LTA synthase family protein [Deefgea piscis]QKJ66118.1 LTA synthase family protein [Deefgea piscis]
MFDGLLAGWGLLASACAWPVALGLTATVLIERLAQPRPQAIWRRPWAMNALLVCAWAALFCFELALFQRPAFAAVLATGLLLLLVLISNSKFHSLREPFIVQDFEYIADAIRHPRLYLPFFGVAKALFCTALFFALLYLGVALEDSVLNSVSYAVYWSAWAGLVLAVVLAVQLLRRAVPAMQFCPTQDQQQFGFFATLFAYYWAEQRHPELTPPAWPLPQPNQGVVPHLLVVQSESFVDFRRYYPQIRPDILSEYDRFCAESLQYGQLAVPAWGANTVRSEFAFLSGLSPQQLGVHQFNPYRRFARQYSASLAAQLRQQGYRTVCIHPYAASFYHRDALYPQLGFDEFIDISAFAPPPAGMPYVDDLQVAAKMGEVLAAATQPTFIFVITMENHGPLHLEQLAAGDAEQVYHGAAPKDGEELTIYLRHQANANRMLAQLRAQLTALARPATLCWYGDHVPILPKVYAAHGEPSGNTDYFIWQTPRKTGYRRVCKSKGFAHAPASQVSTIAPRAPRRTLQHRSGSRSPLLAQMPSTSCIAAHQLAGDVLRHLAR